MQNSFAKKYDKVSRPDGTVAFSITTTRWGAHSSGLLMAIYFALFLASCATTYPVLPKSAILGESKWVWPLVSVALATTILIVMQKTRSSIVVHKGVGLEFGGKTLPFKDIQNIGTCHETRGNDPKGSAYIYAESLGNRIKLSGHMKKELADAVRNEIIAESNISWS